MSKFIIALFILATFAACTTKPASTLQTELVVLTPGKRMHVYNDEMQSTTVTDKKRNAVSKTSSGDQEAFTPERIETEAIPEPIVIETASNEAVHADEPTVISGPVTIPLPEDSQKIPSEVAVPNVAKKDTVSNAAVAVPVKKEKEGWSNATKGAVIGGVGGAIGGAIISKKKVQGAIVGGVIGAAGGYIFGKNKDNKEANESNHLAQHK